VPATQAPSEARTELATASAGAPAIQAVTATPSARPIAPLVPASAEPALKESVKDLVVFGLLAAGAALGIASLFLPWAGSSGIGIGNIQAASPVPNASGWVMPAAWPLFLISLLALGAVSGSEQAQTRMPQLVPVIGRVTGVIMPMLLGGLYLGIVLLYLTFPNGSGIGVLFLLLAGCLLISGAIVTMFLPPEATAKDGAGGLEG
jgi:hypothetical protein